MSQEKPSPAGQEQPPLTGHGKPSLNAAIRHLAERERRTEHPTPRELTAYHEGSLPPEAEARIREHLALCRHCSDLLLDLAGFATLAPPPGVPELTDAEVEADWQALKAKLDEERKQEEGNEAPREPGVVVPIRPRTSAPPTRPSRDFSVWQVAAAAALVASLGLGGWVFVLKNQTKPTRPRLVASQILDQGSLTRGEGEVEKLSSERSATFIFYPEAEATYDRFEGVIRRAGSEVFRNPIDTSDPSKVSFQIEGDTLEPGRYEAALYGVPAGGSPAEIGRIDFEVHAP